MDTGLLMFHVGKILAHGGVGPFFYLSKVESSSEALLWNDIFLWIQLKLGIPRGKTIKIILFFESVAQKLIYGSLSFNFKGTIKGCVLIENILSAFEMDEILFELREHSLGLNCGIWDYAASIVTKFGKDSPGKVN